uniref:La-related protein n=1 Tax=Heligmosomoides polygyrus TaxID=6339 RepID=A0A183GNX1_HELPZ
LLGPSDASKEAAEAIDTGGTATGCAAENNNCSDVPACRTLDRSTVTPSGVDCSAVKVDASPTEGGATGSVSAATQEESFEREELDYDEDDDEDHKEERIGRFTSERNQTSSSTPPTSNAITRVESQRRGDNRPRHQGQRQWQNNQRGNGNGNGRGRAQRFRGNGNQFQHGNRNARGNNGGPPSLLLGVNCPPPPLLAINTYAPPPGGKILINPNFRGGPMGQSGAGSLGPTNMLPPMGTRPSILPSIVPGQAGPIIPRLPNGIPLTAHAHVLHEGLVKAEVAIADLAVREIVSHVVQITREDGEAISVECAKAVGLDNDYLSKLEDQRRKRDEVLRRKEQRRFGGGEQESSSNSRSNDRLGSRQNQKCWKSNEDQVTVIFVEHAKAKEFMLKYNK